MKEIMILMVIMVLRYDVRPTGQGWKHVKGRAHIAASILAPTEDVEVLVSERECREKAQWKFYWGGVELSEILSYQISVMIWAE
jgi:hypothetical protein